MTSSESGNDSGTVRLSALAVFRLKEVVIFEGQNVAIEYRWAGGHYDRIPELVADLLRCRVGPRDAVAPLQR